MQIKRQYVTVRLPKELMDKIDRIIKLGLMGYKSRAEFIKEAIRDKLKIMLQTIEASQSTLEYFNLNERGVKILDRNIIDAGRYGRIVEVNFKPDKVVCEYCKSTNCRHVKFAISLPEVQQILQKKGWRSFSKVQC